MSRHEERQAEGSEGSEGSEGQARVQGEGEGEEGEEGVSFFEGKKATSAAAEAHRTPATTGGSNLQPRRLSTTQCMATGFQPMF